MAGIGQADGILARASKYANLEKGLPSRINVIETVSTKETEAAAKAVSEKYNPSSDIVELSSKKTNPNKISPETRIADLGGFASGRGTPGGAYKQNTTPGKIEWIP